MRPGHGTQIPSHWGQFLPLEATRAKGLDVNETESPALPRTSALMASMAACVSIVPQEPGSVEPD